METLWWWWLVETAPKRTLWYQDFVYNSVFHRRFFIKGIARIVDHSIAIHWKFLFTAALTELFSFLSIIRHRRRAVEYGSQIVPLPDFNSFTSGWHLSTSANLVIIGLNNDHDDVLPVQHYPNNAIYIKRDISKNELENIVCTMVAF